MNVLLENGADINIVNDCYQSILHYAARGGHCAVIEELLKIKANIHAKDNKGCIPLHWAAFKGHTDAVNMLFNYGADVNIVNDSRALHRSSLCSSWKPLWCN